MDDGLEVEGLGLEVDGLGEAADPEDVGDKAAGGGVDALPYTMGTWNGLDQWKCRYCRWDTLEGEAAVMAHYQGAHAPKPPRTRVVALPLVDRFGNVIEREVTDGED